MKVHAIVFGATGMVGEGVLHVALNRPEVESVLVIGRRSCGVHHPKLQEIVQSGLNDLSPIQSRLSGYNACYFCLGVSSIGMKEPDYTAVTYDLTMSVARTLAPLNPEMTFCYVSGAGTDSSERGRSMWARVKGRTENELTKLPFRSALLFRPGFIKPIAGLHHAYTIARILGTAYPLWQAIFPRFVCTLEDLGMSMIRGTTGSLPTQILENVDIARVASGSTK